MNKFLHTKTKRSSGITMISVEKLVLKLKQMTSCCTLTEKTLPKIGTSEAWNPSGMNPIWQIWQVCLAKKGPMSGGRRGSPADGAWDMGVEAAGGRNTCIFVYIYRERKREKGKERKTYIANHNYSQVNIYNLCPNILAV